MPQQYYLQNDSVQLTDVYNFTNLIIPHKQNVSCSSLKECTGVPKGSNFAPFQFLIYINHTTKLKNLHVCLHADDTALYTETSRSDTVDFQSESFRFLSKWNIKINDLNAKSILLKRRRPATDKYVTTNDHNKIQWNDQIKYLGIILNKRLNFSL